MAGLERPWRSVRPTNPECGIARGLGRRDPAHFRCHPLLPDTLHEWFARWEQYGAWHRVAEALCGEADLEELFIDSTILRAHQFGHYRW